MVFVRSQISGDANEEQILTSALVYQDRPIILTKVCVSASMTIRGIHYDHKITTIVAQL